MSIIFGGIDFLAGATDALSKSANIAPVPVVAKPVVAPDGLVLDEPIGKPEVYRV
jgi:hypothetical protein